MNFIEAVILAIIEGITEFLPISSTGHMIIASSLMGIAEDDFTKTFTVSIQFGAILSVVWLYRDRFIPKGGLNKTLIGFYQKILVAFIPAMIIGFLLDDFIDALLGNVLVVAFTLFAGGIFILFLDVFIREHKDQNSEKITTRRAFIIGLYQCIAMIPGVSRSAASIIGGLQQQLNLKTSAEFSFFLAVPTMFAATSYKTLKFFKEGISVDQNQIWMLIVGNVVAFIVAALAIKSFIGFLTKYGLRAFGYYRIVIGILIIILVAFGIDLKITG
ncbi:MAG: undecaprenyl-diphosphate phosphatase [Bacteroidia bacterium]|nr:undecaprenyl-diphosphate phosphatase [Bacteroidia bacterium]MCZ2278445.1 undecaprenyl-diphosphate phosphatase [Bacteroidia bacterium]